MPTVTPLIKINRTKAYGAEIILYGDVYDDSYEYAVKLAEEKAASIADIASDIAALGAEGVVKKYFAEETDGNSAGTPYGRLHHRSRWRRRPDHRNFHAGENAQS